MKLRASSLRSENSRAGAGTRVTGIAAAGVVALSATLAAPAQAEDYGGIDYTAKTGEFADVRLDVENAIINRGLVIDYHGHFGKMLERTGAAVGSETPVFRNAEWLQFCSAALSRAMVEADPRNVGFCPYTIVVYELDSEPGTVQVGYRTPASAGNAASAKALGAVDALLAGIVAEATED